MGRILFLFFSQFFLLSIDSFSDFFLQKIEINGNHNLSKEFILENLLPVKTGEILTDNKLNKILKNLYSTGYFDDLSMKIDKKNNKLELNVVENRVIGEVDFIGLDKFGKTDIEKEILIKKGNMYKKSALKSDIDKLKITYQQFGYSDVKVEGKVLLVENDKINVIFDIDEGQNKKVIKAVFIGNKNLSNFALYDLIDLKGKNKINFFSSGDDFNQFSFEKDITAIRDEYLNQGFLDFKFESTVATLDTYSKNLILTYIINEGEKYKIKSTILENDINNNIDQEAVDKIELLLYDYKINNIYNESQVLQTIKQIKDILSSHGFPFSSVSVDKIKNNDKTVDIKFKILKSNKITIRNIEILGNRRTKDYVIRRELLIKEGDMYDIEKLAKSKDRLTFLGYFKTVDITEKIIDDKTTDLLITLEEQFFGNINFSAGYSTYQGLIGTISLQINNILGSGYSFSTQASRSGFFQTYSIGLFNPRVLNSDFGLGFDFSFSEYGSLGFIGSSYMSSIIPFQSQTFSGNIRTAVKILDRLTYTFGVGSSISKMSALNGMFSEIYQAMYISRQLYKVFHSVSYDQRNFARYATKGYYATYSEEYSGFNVLGNQNYIKRDLSFGFIKPFFNDNIIFSASTSFGMVQSYGKSATLGYESLYTMGYYDIRGFSFYGVGPRVEMTYANGATVIMPYALPAKNYFFGTVDLASPLFLPKEYGIRFSVWCDFGTLYGSPLPYSATNLNGISEKILDSRLIRVAIGAGVSWQSPMGEIRIDFAQPVIKTYYDTPMTFVIRFGNIKF